MRINSLLVNLSGEPASYLSELFTLTADFYAVDLGEDNPEVVRLRRSAWSVGLMKGLDAREKWQSEREKVSWFRRIRIPKDAPAGYIDVFIAEQTQRARDAVRGLTK